MHTRLTSLLGIERPIIQGGLAYLAYAQLAAAVSNAGGLGQITAMSLPSPERLREEIHKVRRQTDKPFGVNFAIGQHGRPYEHMLEVAIEEEVPVITMTGGNPAPLLERLQGTPIKKLVLVANVRQAQKAESLGADAVMAVGQEGGGHIGREDLGTFVLIPRVVESVSIPVVASGGIGDGRGYLAAFALGADGIEMGTRFIATQECVHAHQVYKQLVVEHTEVDTRVIKRSLGAPGRVVKTPLAEKILALEAKGATYEDLKALISGEANRKLIYEGKPEEGFGWAGQVIGLIHDIPTVQELFERMEEEAKTYLAHCNKVFSDS
ncbi:enoyl-[acyl-carrier protein] reductase II [Caldalkalibacillus uzonensis]|uniref:Probable nitronate monooxygenase n=1 Tax=Caldalkalibacillus uzonensis TaxID=353224 RepID=A0ABU0CSM2_9BACI|nr:nitronate monooxygenase family protein [Caldalkalibacillus uzonensis]MDQ0339132.1 enoyl-[acyl-carrier protein] reductase II [Caldalkalibacillus uzonensis]